jgi:hypothetical protein
MVWVLVAVAVAVVVLAAVAVFLFGPTVKTFFGPDFEPAPKDDASVENAVQTRMVDGGGGGV